MIAASSALVASASASDSKGTLLWTQRVGPLVDTRVMLGDLSARARLVASDCSDYPAALHDLSDAPAEFRIAGELPDLRRAVAIVGTRRAVDGGHSEFKGPVCAVSHAT